MRSSFSGAEKRSGNEKPAGNTLCIGKGFEAAWAFFCPSKPCVSLSIDGTIFRRSVVYYPYHKFRRMAEKAGEVVNASEDIPKSFVVCRSGNKKILYLSQMASATLLKRAESGLL